MSEGSQRVGRPKGTVAVRDQLVAAAMREEEILRLLRQVHAVAVERAPAGDPLLIAAARKVVAARYSGGEWEELKNAIGELEDLVGRPEPSR